MIARGRPIVASEVVPAAETPADAAIVYPADDVGALFSALERMLCEPGLQSRLQTACAALAPQFFDPERGLEGAMASFIAD